MINIEFSIIIIHEQIFMLTGVSVPFGCAVRYESSESYDSRFLLFGFKFSGVSILFGCAVRYDSSEYLRPSSKSI